MCSDKQINNECQKLILKCSAMPLGFKSTSVELALEKDDSKSFIPESALFTSLEDHLVNIGKEEM